MPRHFPLCPGHCFSRIKWPLLVSQKQPLPNAPLFLLTCWCVPSLRGQKKVELDPKEVARHYLKGWFAIDVMSGIPYALILLVAGPSDDSEPNWASNLKILKLSRTFRVLRLMRFLKISRLLKNAKLLKSMDRETIDLIQDTLAHYG